MSKKAKTSGPTDDVDPEKTPENASKDTDVVMDDSAPQDPATDANPPEADPATHVDPSSLHATPPSPAADPPSPATNRQAQLLIRRAQLGILSICRAR